MSGRGFTGEGFVGCRAVTNGVRADLSCVPDAERGLYRALGAHLPGMWYVMKYGRILRIRVSWGGGRTARRQFLSAAIVKCERTTAPVFFFPCRRTDTFLTDYMVCQ